MGEKAALVVDSSGISRTGRSSKDKAFFSSKNVSLKSRRCRINKDSV